MKMTFLAVCQTFFYKRKDIEDNMLDEIFPTLTWYNKVDNCITFYKNGIESIDIRAKYLFYRFMPRGKHS